MDIAEVRRQYEALLADAQVQFQRTLAEAQSKLEEMIGEVNKPKAKPQSAWVTGNDGERMLILNEVAAKQLEQMFDLFQLVIAELRKGESK